MKGLTILIGSIFIVTVIPFGRALAGELPAHVQTCLRQGASQRSGRYGGVSEIDVFSMFTTENQTYLQAKVTPVSGADNGWSIVVNFDADECVFIGDDYVAELGLYGEMPVELVKAWTIQLIQPRLKAVGKEKMSAYIKASEFKWHPGQIEAFKKLNLI